MKVQLTGAAITLDLAPSDTSETVQKKLRDDHQIDVSEKEASAFLKHVRSFAKDEVSVDFNAQFPTAKLPQSLQITAPTTAKPQLSSRNETLAQSKPTPKDLRGVSDELSLLGPPSAPTTGPPTRGRAAVVTAVDPFRLGHETKLALVLPDMSEPSKLTRLLSLAKGDSSYMEIVKLVGEHNRRAVNVPIGNLRERRELSAARATLLEKCEAWTQKHSGQSDKSHTGSVQNLMRALREMQSKESEAIGHGSFSDTLKHVLASNVDESVKVLVRQALETLPRDSAKVPAYIDACKKQLASMELSVQKKAAPYVQALGEMEAGLVLNASAAQLALTLLGGSGKAAAPDKLAAALSHPVFSESIVTEKLVNEDLVKDTARTPLSPLELVQLSMQLKAMAPHTKAFDLVSRALEEAATAKPAEAPAKYLEAFARLTSVDERQIPPSFSKGWGVLSDVAKKRLRINVVKAEVELACGAPVTKMRYFSGAVGGYMVELGGNKHGETRFAKMVINHPAAGTGDHLGAQDELEIESRALLQLRTNDPDARYIGSLVEDPRRNDVGTLFLSEFFASKEMSEFAGHKGRSEAEVLPRALQMAKALAYCQRCGLLHRDVKPGNFLESATGQVKLIDFNTAVPLTSKNDAGTPSWAPKEEHPYTAATEVFSLGASIAVLLGAQREDARFGLAPENVATMLKSLPSTTSPEMAKLLGAMLAPVPEARPSMSEVVKALETLQ
ncbi:MAG: protein kinase [Deltaproteobacteria bacterium]|nr:protein kinase [Deltaproteobacteria bacterium]